MNFSRRQLIAASASLALANRGMLAPTSQLLGLKNVFKSDFLIGTAVAAHRWQNTVHASTYPYENKSVLTSLIPAEFNALTLENEMKWRYLQPEENQWDWQHADAFVAFCQTHSLYSVGHTLVWHEQLPPGYFTTLIIHRQPLR